MRVLTKLRERRAYKQETQRLRTLPLEEIELSGTQRHILRSNVEAEHYLGRGGDLQILSLQHDMRDRGVQSVPSHDQILGEAFGLQRLGLVNIVGVSDTFVRITDRGRAFTQLQRR